MSRSLQHEAPADPKAEDERDGEETCAWVEKASRKAVRPHAFEPAQPVEIAPVFVFLASNEARFVTGGEVYGVTGGQTPY